MQDKMKLTLFTHEFGFCGKLHISNSVKRITESQKKNNDNGVKVWSKNKPKMHKIFNYGETQ